MVEANYYDSLNARSGHHAPSCKDFVIRKESSCAEEFRHDEVWWWLACSSQDAIGDSVKRQRQLENTFHP
ncbi:hypothetical protein VFPFJ_01421 [Purpureocillium lilacinum]|uniref:Uncharacterized protein n=1 Tax=Purpureocillium lilacinum TaxID=33203 RepID=A0A179I0E7_PURLI|nr:hypothetical protein VFPFJ_01421 [Purpureocillium lilacinum]OAQ95311.1 hypothetical protein VFPFJ_01421 [Purpureocillium lilacinum]